MEYQPHEPETTDTWHRHKCPRCGTVFQHHPSNFTDTEKAHTCPKPGCGAQEFFIYRGSLPPLYRCGLSLPDTERHSEPPAAAPYLPDGGRGGNLFLLFMDEIAESDDSDWDDDLLDRLVGDVIDDVEEDSGA